MQALSSTMARRFRLAGIAAWWQELSNFKLDDLLLNANISTVHDLWIQSVADGKDVLF